MSYWGKVVQVMTVLTTVKAVFEETRHATYLKRAQEKASDKIKKCWRAYRLALYSKRPLNGPPLPKLD